VGRDADAVALQARAVPPAREPNRLTEQALLAKSSKKGPHS